MSAAFSGDGAGEQGLPRAWGPCEDEAVGLRRGSDASEKIRVFEREFDQIPIVDPRFRTVV